MRAPLDVAIAGAGPAGLAAALFLKRAGHRVTLFERFATPAPVGSGLILQPTGLTVMDRLGLLGAMTALGSRIERLHGCDASSGRTVLDVRYAALRGGRFGLAVHRAALFAVLYRAVLGEGIAIETGVELDAMEAGAGATLLSTAGRRIGPFDLVVDASGTRSRLRRHALRPCEPRPLAYGAFWASLGWRGEGFDAHALAQRYDRASVMAGVLPIGRPDPAGEPMAAFFWSLKPDEAGGRSGLPASRRGRRGWPACGPTAGPISTRSARSRI